MGALGFLQKTQPVHHTCITLHTRCGLSPVRTQHAANVSMHQVHVSEVLLGAESTFKLVV
jgi:hypothetical protein